MQEGRDRLETDEIERQTFYAPKNAWRRPRCMEHDGRHQIPPSTWGRPHTTSRFQIGRGANGEALSAELGLESERQILLPGHMRRGGIVNNTTQRTARLARRNNQQGNSGSENLWFVQHLRMRLARAPCCAHGGGYDGSGSPYEFACDVLSSNHVQPRRRDTRSDRHVSSMRQRGNCSCHSSTW